jgi:hypothetical protein
MVPRRSPEPKPLHSAASAVGSIRKTGREVKDRMSRLNEADRDRAWAEIAEQFKQYEGPNGVEIPGEVLIGVGANYINAEIRKPFTYY